MFGPLYDVDHPEPPDPLAAAPLALAPPAPGAEGRMPMPPSLRSRLHVICALYAHTPQPERRLALLDHLERLTLEAAEMLAAHLLASGWRPQSPKGTSEAA